MEDARRVSASRYLTQPNKYWQNRGISIFVEVDFFPACGVPVSYSGPSHGVA